MINERAFLDILCAIAKTDPDDYSVRSPSPRIKLPSEDEDRLLSLHCDFKTISREAVDFIRNSLTLREAYALIWFAERMAVLSIRRSDQRCLEAALIAMIIDANHVDDRDRLVCLSFLNYSCEVLGVSFENAVQNVIGLADNQSRKIIQSFLARPSEMKTPDVMGFIPHGSGGQFAFIKRKAV